MVVQAAIRTTDEQRYRIKSLSDDLPVAAEGDTREEAIQNFRVEADKAMRQSVEIITFEIPEPMPDKEPTLGESPAWQKLQGSLNEEEHEVFMEGIYRRRHELDELEEKLALQEDGGTLGDSPAWQKLAGRLAADPHADAFLEGIAARRRELEEAEG